MFRNPYLISLATLLFAGSAVFSVNAHAASFDCLKARTPIEHAICDDRELSQLDSELDNAYRKALEGQGDDASALQTQQRAWLKSRQLPDGNANPDNLKSAYRERIDVLSKLPVFPRPDQPVEGPSLQIHNASNRFDFTIRMLSACDTNHRDTYQTCEGPGQVLVHRKGDRGVMQTINMSNIFVAMQERRKPLVNSANLYDYQGAINVGDFNFDGHEDFAIQNGNNGSYGGPSYDVYLFDPATARFVFNESMSELIEETLGFFDVDPAKKVLRTTAKSGCCYHEFTTYRVERNTPVAIARHIEALTADGERMEIRDERLVNGKWQNKTRYERAPQ